MKGGNMNVKKILMMLGIVVLGIVVVIGAIFGISYLTGAFEDKAIAIRTLYFENPENSEDTSIKEMEIRTLDDFKAKISFLPADANKTTLTVTTKGAAGALDNFPSTVKAGEEFDVKLAKDEYNNNVGGAVELKFTDESGQALCYIRVAVDVVSADNSIFFSNEAGSSNISSDGITQLVMSKSGDQSKVIFKSSLANSIKMYSGFNFKTENYNNQKKDVKFDISYFDSEGNKVSTDNWEMEEITKTSNGKIITTFEFKVTPTHTGNISIKAKMHRTYRLQEEFVESGFEDFGTVYTETEGNKNTTSFYNLHMAYNDFINHNIDFFNKSEDATRFFDQFVNNQGLIVLPNISSIIASLDYVYVHSEIVISVVSVQLTDMTIANPAVHYKVFDDIVYSIDTLKDGSHTKGFGVNIDIDNDTIEDYDAEINKLFGNITMTPYEYVDPDNVDSYDNPIAIVGFDEETELPIIYDSDIYSDFEIIGYIAPSNRYIEIKETAATLTSSKTWAVKSKLPILTDAEGNPQAKVYVMFETTSRDVDTGEMIKKSALSQVFVDYTKYSGSIYINELKDIAINNDLTDTENYALKTQEVSLNTASVSNMELVEYKKTLYFVEKNSNLEANNPKVLTSGYTYNIVDNKKEYKDYTGGVYKFVDIENGKLLTADEAGTTPLEGLRILDDATTPDIAELTAINASSQDIYVFAVVVMTDVDGNPIDRNGNKITLSDELDTTLVVVASTFHYFNDLTGDTKSEAYSVSITTFMDTVYFYTISSDNFNDGLIDIYTDDFYLRNFESTLSTDRKKMKKLKMLVGYDFELIISNQTLNPNGTIDTAQKLLNTMTYKDINGNTQSISAIVENTEINKKIAFDKITWQNYGTGYALSINANVDVSYVEVPDATHYVKLLLSPKATVATSTEDGIDMQLAFSSSTMPYCNNVEGRVRYSVNTFDIASVKLNTDNAFYVELFAKYTNGKSNMIEFNYENAYGAETLYQINDFFSSQNDDEEGVVSFDIITDLVSTDEDTGMEMLSESKVDMSQWDVMTIKEYVDIYTESLNYGAEFIVADEVTFIGNNKIYADMVEMKLVMNGALTLQDEEISSEISFPLDGDEINGYHIVDTQGITHNLIKETDGSYSLPLNASTYAGVTSSSGTKYMFILGNRYKLVTETNEAGTVTSTNVYINGIPYAVNVTEYAYRDYIDYEDVYIQNGDGNYVINFKKGLEEGKRVYVIYKLGFGLTTSTTYERYLYQLMTYDVHETPITVKLLNPDGSANNAENPYVITEDIRTFDMVFEGEGKMIELLKGDNTPAVGYSNYFTHLVFEIDPSASIRYKTSTEGESKLICKPVYTQKYQINTVNVYSTFTNTSSVLKIYLDGMAEPVESLFYLSIKADLTVEVNDTHDYYEGRDNEYIYMSLNYDTSVNNVNTYKFIDLFNTGADSNKLISIKNHSDEKLRGTLSLTGSNKDKLTVDTNIADVADFISPDLNYFTIRENYLVYNGAGNISDLRKYFDIFIHYVAEDNTTICYGQKLRVYINPTYTIDVRPINTSNPANIKSVFNGTDLYDNKYIQVYNGMSIDEADLLDKSLFVNLFKVYVDCSTTEDSEYDRKLSSLSGGNAIIQFSGSKLNLRSTLPEDIVLKLQLQYTLNSNHSLKYSSFETMYINLIGMELYIDEEGTFDDAVDDYDSIISEMNGNVVKYPNSITYDTNFNSPLMEFEVNNGDTIDINKFMKIYSADNGSHYMTGHADQLRIEWDSAVALPDMTIDLTFEKGVTGYYQTVKCELEDGVTEAKQFEIDIYIVANNYEVSLQYSTLYKLGSVMITINP